MASNMREMIPVRSNGEYYCELHEGVDPLPEGTPMLVQPGDPSDFGLCLPCLREALATLERFERGEGRST